MEEKPVFASFDDSKNPQVVHIHVHGQLQSFPILEINGVLLFDFNFVRFSVDRLSGDIRPLAPHYDRSKFPKSREGLSGAQVDERRRLFGQTTTAQGSGVGSAGTSLSVIPIVRRSVQSPLFLFQIICVAVWLMDKYYLYAYVVVILAVASRAFEIWSEISNLAIVRQLVRQTSDTEIVVVREGKKFQIRASELVVDDIVKIPKTLAVLPCDCLVLSGEVLADISLVTGESAPCRVHPLPPVAQLTESEIAASRLLHGCRIMQASDEVFAVVTAPGFYSTQGLFLRSVLTSRKSPAEKKLERTLTELVLVLLGLALVGAFVAWHFLASDDVAISGYERIILAADVLTSAVPPALPLAISLVLTVTGLRLPVHMRRPRSGRYSHVLVGLVDALVLDKTDTLTTRATLRVAAASLSAHSDLAVLRRAVAACQNLGLWQASDTGAGGSPERLQVVGDPLEKTLLEYSGFAMDEFRGANFLSDGRETLEVVARHVFLPQLGRMSVQTRSSDEQWIFAKGAAEAIAEICMQPDEARRWVAQQSRGLTGRVLAVAGRKLERETSEFGQYVERRQAEKELQLIGVVAVAEELDEAVKRAVREVQQAGISVHVCSGDSAAAAGQVASEIGGMQSVNHRMDPLAKAQLLRRLAKQQHTTMMVGDGPNDAPALANADVGLVVGIGESEILNDTAVLLEVAAHSLATTRGVEILPELVAFGRFSAALLFTVVCWVSVYAVIQATAVTFLYSLHSNLTVHQYIFIDLALVVGTLLVAVLSLSHKVQPDLRLPALRSFFCCLAKHATISGLVQTAFFLAIKQQQSPEEAASQRPSQWLSGEGLQFRGLPNSSFFLVACLQILIAFIYMFVRLLRPFATAVWPLGSWFGLVGLLLVALVFNFPFIRNWLDLVDLEVNTQLTVLAAALAQAAAPQFIGT